MHEAARIVLLRIPPIFGGRVDLSVTGDVLMLWVAAALTFVILYFGCRRTGLFARGAYQNLFEEIIQYIDREVIRGAIGRHGDVWTPFILALFFFILFCNLMGIFPVPALIVAGLNSGHIYGDIYKPLTSNINITMAMALTVFIVSQVVDMWKHGPIGYIKRVVPSGMPAWITPFLFVLEYISRLVRPLSLTLRLFANMTAGHAIGLALITLGMSCAWFLKPLPYIGMIVMTAFELFVCLIQAFVFTILTAFYIREAVEDAH